MNRRDGVTVLCFMATGVVAALTYPQMPHTVPVHWGVDGMPDRFGSRLEALATVPLIVLGCVALLWGIERSSAPDRANAQVLSTARLGLGALALLLTVAQALHWEMGRVVLVGSGGLFALLGNVLGRTQPSVFVGLRTPWVFLSRRAWFASQRRTAWWLTGLGVVLLLAAALCPTRMLFPWVAPVGLLIGVGGMVVWLVYASFLDWKHDPSPEPVFKP